MRWVTLVALGLALSAPALAQEARLLREAQMRAGYEAMRSYGTIDAQRMTPQQQAALMELATVYQAGEVERLRARARRRRKVLAILTPAQRDKLRARQARELEAIRYARWRPPAPSGDTPQAVERARLLAAERRLELQLELINTPRVRDLQRLASVGLAPSELARALALDARQQRALRPSLFRALDRMEDAYHADRQAGSGTMTVARHLEVAGKVLAAIELGMRPLLRAEQQRRLAAWRPAWRAGVRQRLEAQRERRQRWTPSGQAEALLATLRQRAGLDVESAAAIKPRLQALIELKQGSALDAYSEALMALHTGLDPSYRQRNGGVEPDAGWVAEKLATMRRARKAYEAKLRATEARVQEVLTVQQEAMLVSGGTIR